MEVADPDIQKTKNDIKKLIKNSKLGFTVACKSMNIILHMRSRIESDAMIVLKLCQVMSCKKYCYADLS